MGTGWRVDSGLTAIVGNLNRVGAALIAAIKLAGRASVATLARRQRSSASRLMLRRLGPSR